MAGNVMSLHRFADDVGPLPLVLLDQNYDAVVAAVNNLNNYSNFYTDTGTTNQIVLTTPSSQNVSLGDGLKVMTRIASTNTGPVTLNINNLGALPVVNPDGTQFTGGELRANTTYSFIYNAARAAWQIGGDGGGQSQFTVPLAVVGNDGQPLLQLNTDGTGAIGEPPCQLVWDNNCNWIFAGNSSVTIPTLTATSLNAGSLTAGILNAATGALGTAPNQLVFDSAGNFTLTGTATLPLPPLIDLPGINVTNPLDGQALVYNQSTNEWINSIPTLAVEQLSNTAVSNPQQGQALVYDAGTQQWVNGAPVNALATLNDVALSNPLTGQTLTYNGMTQRWVNSPPVLALEGLINTHISGPVSGQVLTYSTNPTPGWVNATIPGYTFLTNLGVGPNPAAGWVLTWDGQAWVGAAPGEVAQFPLSSLTDVGITTPLNRQVLTYDAPSGKWINAPAPSPSLATLPDVALTAQTQGQVLAWDNTLQRWVNSALPGGSVIALDTLMDTNISDPQNNQVLTWDYASARWVNRALPDTFAGLSDVQLTGPTNGQMLYFNGPTQRWVNGNPSINQLGDVHTSGATSGQVLSYNGTSWVNATLPTQALAGLSDVALATPINGQVLVYNATSQRWVNGNTVTGPFNVNASSGNSLISTAASGAAFFIGETPSGNAVNMAINDGGNAFVSFIPAGANPITGVLIGTASAIPVAIYTSAAQRLVISPNGNVIVNVPTAGPALTVNTLSGQMSAVLQSENGITNGVMWQQLGRTQWQALQDGGTDTWRLWNQNSGTVLSANNSGGFVVNQPLVGSTALTVAGRFTPTSVAAFQAQGGSNNPGLYINMQDSPSKVSLIASGTNIPTNFSIGFANGEAVNFAQINSATFYAPYVQVPNMAGTGVTGLPYVVIDGNGNLLRWGATSSLRYKTNIHSVIREQARAVLSKLRAITYTSTIEGDDPERVSYGLIAEEVAKADPRLVYYKEGKPESVIYERVAMLLLPLMQELLGMDEPEQTYG